MPTDVSSHLFAPAHSWVPSSQFLSLRLFHPQLSLVVDGPQSHIHFTKVNIPTNKTTFSSLIGSLFPITLLRGTALLLLYSDSTSALANRLPKLVHRIPDEILRGLNRTALILAT